MAPARVLLALLLPLVAGTAAAQKSVDFRSVGDAPAILYDAPSLRGKKLYVAPRGMPVETVVAIDGWLKVRDRTGEMTWIERRAVTDRRTVVTLSATQVRERAEEGAPAVLDVAADVVLELVEPALVAGGWARVRHRDGASGFVRAAHLWGI
ncbi:MAG: hypothetical protein JNM90_03210 [Burkholderiales bacterium]|nr:hypothetical protein [Burkholderiales bacterium]